MDGVAAGVGGGIEVGGVGDFVGEDAGEDDGDCAMVEVESNAISTKMTTFWLAIVNTRARSVSQKTILTFNSTWTRAWQGKIMGWQESNRRIYRG